MPPPESTSARSRSLIASIVLAEQEGPQRGTLEMVDEELLEEEELWRDDDADNHTGWWCVRTDPFPCPASGCTFVAEFMTAAHLVLVWQERDDPNLLWHANRAKQVGRNPRVVSYEPAYGPSASYYAWEAAGRPVHASPTSDRYLPDEGITLTGQTGLTGSEDPATVGNRGRQLPAGRQGPRRPHRSISSRTSSTPRSRTGTATTSRHRRRWRPGSPGGA